MLVAGIDRRRISKSTTNTQWLTIVFSNPYLEKQAELNNKTRYRRVGFVSLCRSCLYIAWLLRLGQMKISEPEVRQLESTARALDILTSFPLRSHDPYNYSKLHQAQIIHFPSRYH